MPSSSSPAKRRKLAHPKGLFRTGRSVWNSTDDWDELVATSSLSTSSVSSRPPRPRALPSLAKAAEDVAVRHFRTLWADGKLTEPAELEPEYDRGGKRKKTGKSTARERKERNERQDESQKGWWELQWPHVPDHLKARVRDGILRMHGGWLSLDVMRKLFLFPPEYHLPGHLLPALSSSKTISAAGIRTIPLHPHPAYAKQMHTLKIQHCGQYSDAAVADIIKSMPKLQSVNLKGCSWVGERCVEEICKLNHLRRVNLKGTKVTAGDVNVLLEEMGQVLEVFKVDDVAFRNPDSVFKSTYPRLTHLCLPGNIINGPRTSISAREKSRMYASMVSAPVARPTPPDATFTWSAFGRIFPALTHLYLPGLLIPAADRIMLASDNTLVKLSLGTGGPAVPASVLHILLASHEKSLVKLHLGHVEPTPIQQDPWSALTLGKVLSDLSVLQDFRMVRDPNSKVSAACDGLMREAEMWLRGPIWQWAKQLKHLHLDLGHALDAAIFCHGAATLETLFLPNTPLSGFIPDWADISEVTPRGTNNRTRTGPAADHDTRAGLSPYWALCLFPMLRSLDLSNTDITTEQVFDMLDACPLLSRVDLTSCRGVDVRLRRRIFAGWKDARVEAT